MTRTGQQPSRKPRWPLLQMTNLRKANNALRGTVIDASRLPLPGVTVTLTGGRGPKVVISGADGGFTFFAAESGDQELRADLVGFSSLVLKIRVVGGGVEVISRTIED